MESSKGKIEIQIKIFSVRLTTALSSDEDNIVYQENKAEFHIDLNLAYLVDKMLKTSVQIHERKVVCSIYNK